MGTLHQAFLIAQWITISSAIILLNKYLLVDLRFHFPLTLVLMHMVFSGGCAYVWSWCGWIEVPKLTCEDIVWRIVPVAICFAASVCLGNISYMYLTVAFIQVCRSALEMYSATGFAHAGRTRRATAPFAPRC